MKKSGITSIIPSATFTQATQNDVMTIHKLAQKIWREHYTDIIGADTVEYMLDLMYAPEVIKQDLLSNIEYFLIKFNSEEIGYFGIKEENEKLFLSRIYIKDEFRGRKIGRQAVNFICSIANERNLSEVYLTVAKNNLTSIEFYKSCGFRITDDICKEIGQGFKMDDHVMSKIV